MDPKLKTYIYKIVQIHPDKYLELQQKMIKEINKNEKPIINDIVNIIKKLIKDKIPAKAKFFGLMLLRDLMELRNPIFLNYFIKYLMDRLFKIAQFKIHEKGKNDNYEKAADCLKIYYDNGSEENRIFSVQFFILNLECWKQWDFLFSNDNKKIKLKVDKIRLLFPAENIYYDYLKYSKNGKIKNGQIEEKQRNNQIQLKPILVDNKKTTETLPNQRKISNLEDIPDQSKNTKTINGGQKQNSIKNLDNSLTEKESVKSITTFEEETINENMKISYNTRNSLFNIIRKLQSKDDFPYKQVPDFHKKIKEERNFFEIFQKKIIKSKIFSQQLKNNFFRDFNLTKEIDNIFDDLVDNKISLNEFHRGLKVLEYNNKTGTFISLENFSKYEEEDLFKNFGSVEMEKMPENKVNSKIKDFEISFEEEKNSKMDGSILKEQEFVRDRKFSSYRKMNNLKTILEESKEVESNKSKINTIKLPTDDFNNSRIENMENSQFDIKFDNLIKNRSDTSQFGKSSHKLEKSDNSQFEIKFDNFNKNDITKPNMYFSHLPDNDENFKNVFSKSDIFNKSKSKSVNNKKPKEDCLIRTNSLDKNELEGKRKISKKSKDKLSKISSINSNDFSNNSEGNKNKFEPNALFTEFNFQNNQLNHDFDEFDKGFENNDQEKKSDKNQNLDIFKFDKKNNKKENKEIKKKDPFPSVNQKVLIEKLDLFDEFDDNLMKKEKIEDLFKEFSINKENSINSEKDHLINSCKNKSESIEIKNENTHNFQHFNTKKDLQKQKDLVNSNLQQTPLKIKIIDFENSPKNEKVSQIEKSSKNKQSNIFEEFSKKNLCHIFEDSSKKDFSVKETFKKSNNSGNSSLYEKDQNIHEETFHDKTFKNPIFKKIIDENLISIKKENFDKSNFFDFDDKEEILENKKGVIKKTIKIEKKKSLNINHLNLPKGLQIIDQNKNLEYEKKIQELEKQLEIEKIEKGEMKISNLTYKNQCETLFKRLFETQKQLEIYQQNEKIQNGENNLNTINKEILSKECEKNIQKRKNEYLIEENRMIHRLNKEISQKDKTRNLKMKKENSILKELVKQLQLHCNNLQNDLDIEKKENLIKEEKLKNLDLKITCYNKEFIVLKKSIFDKNNEKLQKANLDQSNSILKESKTHQKMQKSNNAKAEDRISSDNKNLPKDVFLAKKQLDFCKIIKRSKSISIEKKEDLEKNPHPDNFVNPNKENLKEYLIQKQEERNKSKNSKNKEESYNSKTDEELEKIIKETDPKKKTKKELNKRSILKNSLKDHLKLENENLSEIFTNADQNNKLNETCSMDVYKQMLFNIQNKSKNSIFDEYSLKLSAVKKSNEHFDVHKTFYEEYKKNKNAYDKPLKNEEKKKEKNSINYHIYDEYNSKNLKKKAKSNNKKNNDDYQFDVSIDNNQNNLSNTDNHNDNEIKDKNNLENEDTSNLENKFNGLQRESVLKKKNKNETKKERFVDEKLANYINLQNYPFYEIPKNEIFLKASSLFKNSIIFENEFLSIYSKTETNLLRVEKIVTIELTFKPKIENLKITTHILSYENIEINPPLIIRQFFDRNITQEYILKTFGDFQFYDFPKLEISISLKNENHFYFIPLPFSINKFVKFQEIDQNYINYFFETSKIILNQKILLNIDIIDTWYDLLKIFPNLVKISEREFLLLINFGGASNVLLQLNILSNDLLDFSLLAKEILPSFYNFAKWFFWIFTL